MATGERCQSRRWEYQCFLEAGHATAHRAAGDEAGWPLSPDEEIATLRAALSASEQRAAKAEEHEARLCVDLAQLHAERDGARAQLAEAQAACAVMRSAVEDAIDRVWGPNVLPVAELFRAAVASPNGRALLDENARLRAEVERLQSACLSLNRQADVLAGQANREKARADEATGEVERLRREVAFFAERLEKQDNQYSHGHPAAARYRARRVALEQHAARWKALARRLRYERDETRDELARVESTIATTVGYERLYRAFANAAESALDAARWQSFGLAWVAVGHIAEALAEVEEMESQADIDEAHGGTCNDCAAKVLRERAGYLRAALAGGKP